MKKREGGAGEVDTAPNDDLLDVFQLRNDLLGGLRNPKIRNKQGVIERLVIEIGAQLIEYCYSEVFDLPSLVRITAEEAQAAGMQGGLARIIELWEIGHLPAVAALLEPPKKSKAKKSKPQPEKTLGELAGDEPEEQDARGWQIDRNGKIRPNEANALKALEVMGIEVAYDVFRREARITGLDNYGPTLDRDTISEIYLAIQRQCFFKIGFEDLERIIRSAARRNSYDPITDYLDGLQWDGVERLDEWLATYGGAENSPYTREVGAKFLIAAVRRARQPGCKFDYMVIFEGEEGRGKSSVGAILAGQEYFTDSIPIHSHDPRHTIEALRGKWICEAGELAAIKRAADVETVKAWLSRSTDTAALKWERDSVGVPRRFVTFGTVNPDGNGYFEGKTGNRRFWPVTVEGFDLPAVTRDRDNLWAEAAWREARGESLEISAGVIPQAREAQKDRETQDAWEEILTDWAANPAQEFITSTIPKVVEGRLYRIAEVALGIKNDKLSRADQMRIGVSLARIGFKKEHTRTGKIWKKTTYEL